MISINIEIHDEEDVNNLFEIIDSLSRNGSWATEIIAEVIRSVEANE